MSMVKILIVLIAIQNCIFMFTTKDKSARLLVRTRAFINNCCETHFHLLRIVLRSFKGYNTTE